MWEGGRASDERGRGEEQRQSKRWGSGGSPALPAFCTDVVLTASDRGCSASRQNEIASTGLMTSHGQHSLFLKVTGWVFMAA